MADRSSAEVFGVIFDILAENPTKDHKDIALRLWNKSMYYEFNEDQMDCDKSLVSLDLAVEVDISDGWANVEYREYK